MSRSEVGVRCMSGVGGNDMVTHFAALRTASSVTEVVRYGEE